MQNQDRNLDMQRVEFGRNRFLAMPLAGLLVWTLLLIPGWLLPVPQAMLMEMSGADAVLSAIGD